MQLFFPIHVRESSFKEMHATENDLFYFVIFKAV